MGMFKNIKNRFFKQFSLGIKLTFHRYYERTVSNSCNYKLTIPDMRAGRQLMTVPDLYPYNLVLKLSNTLGFIQPLQTARIIYIS